MDNSLISCLGYVIYSYRTVIHFYYLYIHLQGEETITKVNYLSTLPTLFFRILLVQGVINLENIGQKTLEKPEGVANIGQFRNMNHIGLKSENNDTQHRIKQ